MKGLLYILTTWESFVKTKQVLEVITPHEIIFSHAKA